MYTVECYQLKPFWTVFENFYNKGGILKFCGKAFL